MRLLSKVTLAAGGQRGVVIWLMVVPGTRTHDLSNGTGRNSL